MRFFTLVGILLLGVAAGCDQASMVKLMTPAEDEVVARNYLKLLRENNFEQIEKDADPKIRTPALHDTLVEMAAMIPPGEPTSMKVVGTNTQSSVNSHKSNITFEYQFQSKWLLANVAVEKKNGTSTIFGFRVQPLPDSLENMNKFSLDGKSSLHYAVVTLVALIPIFILYALILCIRTKIPKRKWLWIIFILLGFGKIAFNWASGEWVFQALAFQLFGAGAVAAPYGPWTLTISLPLGAIWFLICRQSFINAPVEMMQMDKGSE